MGQQTNQPTNQKPSSSYKRLFCFHQQKIKVGSNDDAIIHLFTDVYGRINCSLSFQFLRPSFLFRFPWIPPQEIQSQGGFKPRINWIKKCGKCPSLGGTFCFLASLFFQVIFQGAVWGEGLSWFSKAAAASASAAAEKVHGSHGYHPPPSQLGRSGIVHQQSHGQMFSRTFRFLCCILWNP